MAKRKLTVRSNPPAPDTRLAELGRYLEAYFAAQHPLGTADVVPRATELLDELRDHRKQKQEEARQAQASLSHAHANAVKGAVARLIGGYQKLSVEDLKKQALEMIGDDKFWKDLSTVGWAQDEMRKMLGPYAY